MAKVGKAAALGLGAAVVGATVVLVKSAQAALDAEKSQTRLDSAFKHAGASAKEHAAAMKAVNDVSVKSGLDDEDLADSLARLTQVTGDASKATEAMATAADVARAKGISLEAATGIMTKAALGNVGALKRQGIEIPKVTAAQDALKESHTKATVEQVKAAKAADDLATRQGALAALQKKFGGDAESYGKTASGAMDRFHVAIENVEEGIGAALLPALAKAAGGVADFLEKFNQAEGAGAKFRVVIDEVKTLAGQAWEALKSAFDAINWGQVWDSVITEMKAGVSTLFIATKQAVNSVDWEGAVKTAGDRTGQGLVAAINKLDDWVKKADWESVGRAFVQGTAKAVGGMALYLAHVDWLGIIGSVVKLWVGAWKSYTLIIVGAVKAVGVAAIGGLKAGLDDGWPKVWNFIKQIPGTIKNLFADAGSWLYNAGLSILTGLWNGMKAKWDAVAGWIGSLGGKIVGLKGPPSTDATLLTENGKLIIRGLQDGMMSAWPSAAQWLSTIGGMTNTKISEGVKDTEGKLKDALEESMSKALKAAQDKVDDSKSSFGAAFGRLSSAISGAFSTIAGGKKTPSEIELEKMDKSEKEKALLKAESDAGLLLMTAQTNEERLAAEEAYAAAEQAIQRYNLEQQAQTERVQQNAINTIRSEALSAALSNLQTKLEEGKVSYEQWHKSVMSLLEGYVPDWKTKGGVLGNAIVKGIEAKIADAAAAAKKLAQAFAINIKVQATAAAVKVDGARAAGGPVWPGGAFLVGESGPELFVPGTAGSIVANGGGGGGAVGGGAVINVTVNTNGWIRSDRELEEIVTDAVQRVGRRNGGNAFNGWVTV